MADFGSNPKDLEGNKKVSLSKIPGVAELHCAHAMMEGASKYGAWNWRTNAVLASIYVDAAKRHLNAWMECEEADSESLVHHLGHAMACCAILLDAQETGNLLDDRPAAQHPGFYTRVSDKLAVLVAKRREKK